MTLFLAMQREVSGRMPWEMCLLPRPHTPEVGLFVAGMRMLRASGVTQLPIEVAEAAEVGSFAARAGAGSKPDSGIETDAESNVERAWDLVRRSLCAVATELDEAIACYAPPLEEATAYIEATILSDEQRCLNIITDALGVSAVDQPLPIYLVPFAPFPPGTAFLTDQGVSRAAYLDYRRYSGPTMLESLLTLLSWHLLSPSTSDVALTRVVATDLRGGDQAKRRVRAVVMKLLIAMTAAHLVTAYDPRFGGTIGAYGLDLRFPRLLAAIQGPWQHYLQGRTSREKALTLINERLAGQEASWWVEQIDASSLAADFYLLEWLAAQGDRDATVRLAAWQPRLAAGFVRHLDFAIGAELAHYDGIPLSVLSSEMTTFIKETCEGNSLLRWPAARRGTGPDAYRMAEAVFLGPGAEYGGEAWAPVARLMTQYTEGLLSERVFIDQCFTLEHNNGCLFDKFFDTWDMQAALRAQAGGDLTALGAHAATEVRGLLERHLTRDPSRREPPWTIQHAPPPASRPPGEAFHLWPAPGRVGCGSRIDQPEAVSSDGSADPQASTRPLFRGTIRRSHGRDVPELHSVTAVLHTDLGPITMTLDAAQAPLAVGTFVQLARGDVAWRNPATGSTATGPFYDGTRFHRIVPGFLLQAGDRTETGRGGPGFRYDEEPNKQRFDRPYLVGMVNTGIVTNGSQFFITLSKAPHLDGQYTIIGEVADDASRRVAHELSEASRAGRSDLRIKRVEVDTK
ncbi:MAG TPA: peptidylprolyl isomerase [Candidatus Limnocylindrales bacterium]